MCKYLLVVHVKGAASLAIFKDRIRNYGKWQPVFIQIVMLWEIVKLYFMCLIIMSLLLRLVTLSFEANVYCLKNKI